jgi:hypothetical protein
MRILRIVVTWLLVIGIGTPALAGDLQKSIANAAAAQAAQPQEQAPSRPMPKAYLWSGSALFVGGMTLGIYGFLNNRNGAYPEAGEGTSTNKQLGTAGLITAFGGGALLAIGAHRARSAPSITLAPKTLKVTKQFAW